MNRKGIQTQTHQSGNIVLIQFCFIKTSDHLKSDWLLTPVMVDVQPRIPLLTVQICDIRSDQNTSSKLLRLYFTVVPDLRLTED